MAEPSQRLLIFETDPAVRRVLSRRLVREGYDVTELGPATADDVVAKAVADRPDLVLLELGGVMGIEVLMNLREASDAPAIGLLWPDPAYDEAAILDLGADDCLTRPLSFRTLVARIRAVLRRSSRLSVRELRYGTLEIDVAARTVHVRGEPVELAAREFDLLAFLASRAGEAFSREQLLTSVWRSSADWQQRETVTEHVHRLRLRIEEDPSRPRWLVTVRGIGYRFAAASDIDDGRSSITSMTPWTSSPTDSGLNTTRQSMG
jgi:DNA-binding response OmpR family regulator